MSVARYFDPKPVEKAIVHVHGIGKIFSRPLFHRSELPPKLVVSCGFRSEKSVMKIKAAYEGSPFAIHLQRPKIGGYDMVFVSRHDWSPPLDDLPNYHQMLGVPHRFAPEFWETRRPAARQRFAPDDQKVVAVLVGGANGAYAYDDSALMNIKRSIFDLVSQGWRVLLSVSRRSSDDTQKELASIGSENVIVWDRIGENPYVDYLAAADAFLIAKDSITMPCEALSTSRPVYALELTPIPGARLEKFERYHTDLQQTLRLTRPFAGELLPYAYTPPRETERVANLVRRRLCA